MRRATAVAIATLKAVFITGRFYYLLIEALAEARLEHNYCRRLLLDNRESERSLESRQTDRPATSGKGDRRGARGASFVPSALGHLSGYVPKEALPSHVQPCA